METRARGRQQQPLGLGRLLLCFILLFFCCACAPSFALKFRQWGSNDKHNRRSSPLVLPVAFLGTHSSVSWGVAYVSVPLSVNSQGEVSGIIPRIEPKPAEE